MSDADVSVPGADEHPEAVCQRTDQTLHAPGLTVVRPMGSSQRRLRMFDTVGCTYLSAMGCVGVRPGFV